MDESLSEACEHWLENRRNQRYKRDKQESRTNRVREENGKASVGHDEGAGEILFCQASEDDTDDDGRNGKFRFIQEITNEA